MSSRTELALLALLVGCGSDPSPALPYFDSRDFTPSWYTADTLPVDFHRVDAFGLTDQHDQVVTDAELDGKVTVVDFFFTYCTGICPVLTANMGVVDAAFPESAELLLLSHSVSPEHDTVEVLQDFALAMGVGSSRWHLLTGDRDTIYRLGRAVYFVEEDLGADKSPDDFLHTENMVLVDAQRHIRGVYNGLNSTSVQQLIADIGVLLAEG